MELAAPSESITVSLQQEKGKTGHLVDQTADKSEDKDSLFACSQREQNHSLKQSH